MCNKRSQDQLNNIMHTTACHLPERHKQTTIDTAFRQAEVIKNHFKAQRSEESFDKFYEHVLQQSQDLTNPPVLKRQRRIPKRFDDGGPQHAHQTPKDMFRAMYYEVLDVTIQELDDRFGSKQLDIPKKMEQLLLTAFNNDTSAMEANIDVVCEFYSSDLDKNKLTRQLQMVPDVLAEVKKSAAFNELKTVTSVSTIADILKNFPSYADLLSEIRTLIKIFMTIPVSTASAERSFSVLRRLKTYLRSTMNQSRLNHVIMLHCHKDKTDKLNLPGIAQEFVRKNDVREMYFGSFE